MHIKPYLLSSISCSKYAFALSLPFPFPFLFTFLFPFSLSLFSFPFLFPFSLSLFSFPFLFPLLTSIAFSLALPSFCQSLDLPLHFLSSLPPLISCSFISCSSSPFLLFYTLCYFAIPSFRSLFDTEANYVFALPILLSSFLDVSICRFSRGVLIYFHICFIRAWSSATVIAHFKEPNW